MTRRDKLSETDEIAVGYSRVIYGNQMQKRLGWSRMPCRSFLMASMRYLYTSLYIAFIVLCNTVFTYVPTIVFSNLTFSIGDVLVGGVYILRDLAQREIRHYVIIAMLLGGIISYLMADKSVAVASVLAFSLGETLDWLIYTLTKKPLSQRLLWSSLISTPIDSLVFLALTNMLHPLDFTLMMLSKMTGIFLLWLSWRMRRSSQQEEALTFI